ncbi:MAG TPA: nucleoside hydrolase, partial [Chloroflexota bacterium]|nr:nucleoside hydrolase [Chloroflexota bacterium]
AGAELIVREANRDDDRPLHVLFYGPLTDMAAALLMDPGITQRNVHVVWIGGGPWPVGGSEYNLSNDIHAANVVFKSALEVSQIPQSVYRQMAVGYAELYEQVHPCGRLGAYLVEQLVEFNARRPMAMEYRSLGDSPAVGVVLNPACGVWEWRPAPEFAAGMNYLHTGANRPIRVYFSIDSRFIMEDMYAKLRAHTGN